MFAWFAMLFALCCAVPAAAESPIKPDCHAYSAIDTTYAELAAQPDRWICSSMLWKGTEPASWLRFDAQSWQGQPLPRAFVTRITKFEALSLFAVNADGTVTALGLSPEDVKPLAGRSIFSAPLPPVSTETVAVVVRIERPWNAAVLSDARLYHEPDGGALPVKYLVALGIMLGLLFAPVIFDLAFYTVLRERFILLHATLVVAMLAYVTNFTGLPTVFGDINVVTLAKINGFAPVVAVVAGALFVIEFLEPHAISRTMRRALLAAAGFCLLTSGVVALHPPFLSYTWHSLFFIGFIPPLIVHVAALVQAYRRRSRAVKFQIAAWAPVMLCAFERILRGVGIYAAPPMVDELLYIALVLEVVISALGVADRMIALRNQRDSARSEARTQEALAGHDPLTGLLNRRAIEPRFGKLCAEGFTVFALVDLDLFKGINDRYGHAVGDDVLRAAAAALAPDEDTLVVRMGGEEFLLMLRGPRARERAEQRRAMLPRHIAQRVPGLENLVTASMGVLEGTVQTMAASEFNDVYSRADKLLYEAKQAGRNRTIGEKLTVFSPYGRERPSGERRLDVDRKSA